MNIYPQIFMVITLTQTYRVILDKVNTFFNLLKLKLITTVLFVLLISFGFLIGTNPYLCILDNIFF